MDWSILIGPCGDADAESLIHAHANCPRIAADSGADFLLQMGLSADLVVGDLDSLSPDARMFFADVLQPVTEQETTDFHKALRMSKSEGVLALGFLGGRWDHSLTNLSTLTQFADRKIVLVDAQSCIFLCPPQIHIQNDAPMPVSLYPLGEGECASEGLVWPTQGLRFSPLGRLGTSNEARGPFSLAAAEPSLLVILPRSALEQAMQALEAASPWPARESLPEDVHY